MMRTFAISCLLVLMLLTAVLAIYIDPKDIGDDSKKLNFPELPNMRTVYELRILRSYEKKRDELARELTERYRDILKQPNHYKALNEISRQIENDISHKQQELAKHLQDEITRAEQAHEASIGRYVTGKQDPENLRKLLRGMENTVQRHRANENRHRETAKSWEQKAVSGPMERRAHAREKVKYYEDLVWWEARDAAIASKQIRIIKEQLQEIERRQRGQRQDGQERSTTTDDNTNPGGASNDRLESSFAGSLSQQVGRFIGDRIGPLMQRTGGGLQEHAGSPLRLDQVPGGLRSAPQLLKIPHL